jgi:hypothetical protein
MRTSTGSSTTRCAITSGRLARSSTASRATAPRARTIGADLVVVAAVVAAVATAATIGADSRWLAALGKVIVHERAIPDGVPYASAHSAGWPNVPVLAELVLHWLAALGDRGFILAQAVAVGAAFAILAADMRRAGARDVAAALVLITVLVGAASAFFVVRVQLFSLVFFPALALLLRSEARSPSRRVWLVPVLLCVWSNLHGAVLVGLAVALIYTVVDRVRLEPAQGAMVAVASALAVCLTPALQRTPLYYDGVLHNEAARRGEGLWAPLSLNTGTGVVLVVAAVALIGLALTARPRLWELLALLALAVLTVKTARSGVWLLFFAAPPAAVGLKLRASIPRRWAISLACAFALVAVYGVVREVPATSAGASLVRATLQQAKGTPVLADGADAESLALAGGRVWMSNPLDAFDRSDQRLYLDWLDGRDAGARALAHAPRAILVGRGTGAESLTARSGAFRAIATDPHAVLYVRRR